MAAQRTTYILAALVILCTAFVVFFERSVESTAELAAKSGRLLAVNADDIVKVKLRRDQWTSAVVERLDLSAFRVVEPTSGPADIAAVAKILSRAEFLSSTAVLAGDGASDAQLYEYGLTTPRLEVTLALAKGDEVRLLFGKDAPVGGGVYLRIPGQAPVYVVDRTVFEDYDQFLEALSGEPSDKSAARPSASAPLSSGALPREGVR